VLFACNEKEHINVMIIEKAIAEHLIGIILISNFLKLLLFFIV